MNYRHLLEHIQNKILNLGFRDVTKEDIHLPNVETVLNRKNLWFEISIGNGEAINWSELEERRLITINQVACVPAGSGSDRLYYIAKGLESLYAPYISDKAGFIVDGARFRVISCNQMTPDYIDGSYKINVRLIVEKYEEY